MLVPAQWAHSADLGICLGCWWFWAAFTLPIFGCGYLNMFKDDKKNEDKEGQSDLCNFDGLYWISSLWKLIEAWLSFLE